LGHRKKYAGDLALLKTEASINYSMVIHKFSKYSSSKTLTGQLEGTAYKEEKSVLNYPYPRIEQLDAVTKNNKST
jgi:hypothetical protein